MFVGAVLKTYASDLRALTLLPLLVIFQGQKCWSLDGLQLTHILCSYVFAHKSVSTTHYTFLPRNITFPGYSKKSIQRVIQLNIIMSLKQSVYT